MMFLSYEMFATFGVSALLLVLFTCGFCVYRVHRLQQNGQVAILLRPTKVLFSHKKGDENDQLRTVVAYHNPFTGDYCVRSSAQPHGYGNRLADRSPDSGLSDDRYEPLGPPADGPTTEDVAPPPAAPVYDNTLNKTWRWDYTEYQI